MDVQTWQLDAVRGRRHDAGLTGASAREPGLANNRHRFRTVIRPFAKGIGKGAHGTPKEVNQLRTAKLNLVPLGIKSEFGERRMTHGVSTELNQRPTPQRMRFRRREAAVGRPANWVRGSPCPELFDHLLPIASWQSMQYLPERAIERLTRPRRIFPGAPGAVACKDIVCTVSSVAELPSEATPVEAKLQC